MKTRIYAAPAVKGLKSYVASGGDGLLGGDRSQSPPC